jgi:glycerate 2-kinase
MTSSTHSVKLSKLTYAHGKQLAIQILLETMASIDVRHAMRAKVKYDDDVLRAGDVSFPLPRPPRVVAFGKAANRMAAALDAIVGGRTMAGVCVAPAMAGKKLDRFSYFVGGHPYPNAGSLEGARAALELVSNLSPDDSVLFLVSGGGSALFELPIDPAITLADLIDFNRLLVTCGLPIEHMNTLRKHLSTVKGGRLAVQAHPARQLTIFISDVPEGLPSMVASGPTMPDESTLSQVYALAEEKGLVAQFPSSIRELFEARALEETPKPGDKRFERSCHFCLLSNHDAVEGARAAAEKLGFFSAIDTGVWDADFRQVVHASLASLEALARTHREQPVCLVLGGEVNCPVTGPGVGGRNQAFALYSALRIEGQRRAVLSAGTDGRDGNSPTSGAVADGQTVTRARALGIDPATYLTQSDAYSFFRTVGDTVETGFTDNNVRDVRVWLDFG